MLRKNLVVGQVYAVGVSDKPFKLLSVLPYVYDQDGWYNFGLSGPGRMKMQHIDLNSNTPALTWAGEPSPPQYIMTKDIRGLYSDVGKKKAAEQKKTAYIVQQEHMEKSRLAARADELQKRLDHGEWHGIISIQIAQYAIPPNNAKSEEGLPASFYVQIQEDILDLVLELLHD